MQQTEKNQDIQLDQLISIVNSKPRELKPLLQNNNLPNLNPNNEKSLEYFSKTLVFKPWSGKETLDNEDYLNIIKQQIQGSQQKQQQCQLQQKAIDNFSQVSNMAKHDQIGYFYKFQNGAVKLIKKLLDQNGFKFVNSNKNWTIYWSSTIVKQEAYTSVLPYQKINHFPNSFHLTRKDLMNKCISKMQIKYGMSHFNFLPKTYILPQQLELLTDQMNKMPGITYIVKPHNRSQGKGITVTNNLSVVYSKLEKYSSLIVSHYVDNPLLINGLKFDLRIYVAITSINPLRIYVYQEGLARFATETYDQSATDCQNKKFQHLTNYSINKKNTQFVKSQKQNEQYFGSKWRLTALKTFLNFNIGKQQTTQLFNRIDDIIVKTILSGQNILFTAYNNSVSYINSCFQVLGFDVLIDNTLKPWLMEVNMSPSMNSDSSLDIKIKGSMISDLFTMIGITPLQDRYLDGNHLRYDINNFRKSDNKQITIGPIQKFIIKQVEAQHQRRGAWKRVFPTHDRKYKQYFQTDRYFNRLIREHLTSSNSQSALPYHYISQKKKQSIQKDLLSSTNPNVKSKYSSVKQVGQRGFSRQKKNSNFSIKINRGNNKKVYI